MEWSKDQGSLVAADTHGQGKAAGACRRTGQMRGLGRAFLGVHSAYRPALDTGYHMFSMQTGRHKCFETVLLADPE